MDKNGNAIKQNLIPIAKTIVVTAIVTIGLLMILALLLLKAGFNDKMVLIGLGVIYFAANMAGGFIVGKGKKTFYMGHCSRSYIFSCAFISILPCDRSGVSGRDACDCRSVMLCRRGLCRRNNKLKTYENQDGASMVCLFSLALYFRGGL